MTRLLRHLFRRLTGSHVSQIRARRDDTHYWTRPPQSKRRR